MRRGRGHMDLLSRQPNTPQYRSVEGRGRRRGNGNNGYVMVGLWFCQMVHGEAGIGVVVHD